jgi:ABC-2 type transport system permease protein
MRLLQVELRRLAARRVFRWTVVVSILAVLVIDGLIGARSDKDIAGARAAAVRVEQQQYGSCVALAAQQPSTSSGPTKADCDQQRPAAEAKACREQQQRDHVVNDNCARVADMYVNDPRFHFADHARNMLTGAATILMAAAVVLGASAIGAEWQAGTFASLLTWESRRQRVLVAKLAAPTIVVAVLAAITMPLLVAGGWLAAHLRGTTAGTTGHLWSLLAAQYGRSVLLVALVALIAAGLAALTRHTVAALGVVGGYLVAGEIVGGLVSKWWQTHGLVAHLYAFMRGTWSYTTVTLTPTGDSVRTHQLHAAGAAVLVAVLTAAVVAAASTLLSRRDVS